MDEQQSTAQRTQHAGCFFCNVAAPQIEAFLDHVWPENTREHFRNARVEMLKGMRSMLDAQHRASFAARAEGHEGHGRVVFRLLTRAAL